MTTNTAFASSTVTFAELGENPAAVIEAAETAPVGILSDQGTAAYVVAADVFEAMVEALDDLELAELARQRRGGPTRKVNVDDL